MDYGHLRKPCGDALWFPGSHQGHFMVLRNVSEVSEVTIPRNSRRYHEVSKAFQEIFRGIPGELRVIRWSSDGL